MPALLELALNCENYRALPYSGGVMEQPAGLLRKMRQVRNVYEAVKLYKAEGNKPGESAKWKRENEGVWDIVNEVERLRAKYG
jgi:CO/xanthine dehydrogenase Mo-binding subunit